MECRGSDAPPKPPPPAPGICSSTRLFGRALWIPGALHILHGSCHELTATASHFSKFKEQLRSVLGFFLHRHSREAFIHYCLNGRRAGYGQLFENWNCPSFAEWRWGSLMQCISFLDDRKMVLRLFWNSNAMMEYGRKAKKFVDQGEGLAGIHRDAAGDECDDPDAVGKVIADPMFWAFLSLLLNCSRVHRGVEGWFNSCPCHPGPEL
jgi:hypothetical protein